MMFFSSLRLKVVYNLTANINISIYLQNHFFLSVFGEVLSLQLLWMSVWSTGLMGLALKSFWKLWLLPRICSRISYRRCSIRNGVLRNFAKFTENTQSLFFNKAADLRPATLLKKRFWLRCFPVNFGKFLRPPFLKNTSQRLLLMFNNESFNFDFAVILVATESYIKLCFHFVPTILK